MAKRYTDTEKWEDEWFYALPGKMMLAWDYINCHCDAVGIWKVNLRKLSDLIKFEITSDEFKTHFSEKVVFLPRGRIWVPSFIKFQYGKLSNKNRAQLGMMRTIVQETVELPLTGDVLELINKFKKIVFEGQVTPADPQVTLVEGPGNGNGNGNACIKDLEEAPPPISIPAPAPISFPMPASSPGDFKNCEKDWIETLRQLGVIRSELTYQEKVTIAECLKIRPAKEVRYALTGYRFEKRREGYNPAEFVNVRRALGEKMDTWINLAVMEVEKLKKATTHRQHDPPPPDPTETVRDVNSLLNFGGAAK